MLDGVSRVFIRSKIVKDRTYYQVVESYRKDDRVRHHTLASLGTHSTIEDARREAQERHSALRRRGALAADVDKAWYRLVRLDQLLRREQGDDYEGSAAFEAEKEKRHRAAKREGRRRV